MCLCVRGVSHKHTFLVYTLLYTFPSFHHFQSIPNSVCLSLLPLSLSLSSPLLSSPLLSLYSSLPLLLSPLLSSFLISSPLPSPPLSIPPFLSSSPRLHVSTSQ